MRKQGFSPKKKLKKILAPAEVSAWSPTELAIREWGSAYLFVALEDIEKAAWVQHASHVVERRIAQKSHDQGLPVQFKLAGQPLQRFKQIVRGGGGK